MNRWPTAAAAILASSALLAACGSSGGSEEDGDAPEITVFAAASLQAAFDQMSQDYAEANGVTFAPIVYDGSSVLATQLQGGASVDIFASADERNMTTVVDDGLVTSEPEIFATNELVLAVAPGNPLGIETIEDLTKPAEGSDEPPVTVICAEEVPCGGATKTLLDLAGVTLEPASLEQNVTAVLSRVANGEADAGFVYRTDVEGSDGQTEAIEVEGAKDNLNLYPIALLDDAPEPEAAAGFRDYVLSAEGQETLASYGFGAP